MLGPLKSKIRESIEEDLAGGVRVLNQRVIEHFVIPRIRFATFNHLSNSLAQDPADGIEEFNFAVCVIRI